MIFTGIGFKWNENKEDKSKVRVNISNHIRDYLGVGRCKFTFDMTDAGALLHPVFNVKEYMSGVSIPMGIQKELQEKGSYAYLYIIEKTKQLILVPKEKPIHLFPPSIAELKKVEWLDQIYTGDKKIKTPKSIKSKLNWEHYSKLCFLVNQENQQIAIHPIGNSFIPKNYVTKWNVHSSINIPKQYFEQVISRESPGEWKYGICGEVLILQKIGIM